MKPETRRPLILMSFAAIYLIWGSTYLAIRIGLETLPPFLLAGSRFLIAGAALYLWLRMRGMPRPADGQWWSAVVTGVLMLVGGSGGVTWAEQMVPSGIACLLFTTVPLWMTTIEGVVLRRSRVGWQVVAGLILGISGVAVLMGPSSRELYQVHPVGAVVLLGAALSWSLGSLASRRASLPRSPTMTVAVQMLAAGAAMVVWSGALGEWHNGFSFAQVSSRSLLAVAYLVVFGSILGLTAYVWLLRQVSAAAVSTYAFVNPVVAVLLGWLVAGEPVGPGLAVAGALIIGAVVLIQSVHWHAARRLAVEISTTALPAVAEACPETARACSSEARTEAA